MFLQILTAAVVLFLTSRWLLRQLKIRHYTNKHVFITGCDTGFGYLLAKRLDSLGFRVFAGCLTEQGARDLKAVCSDHLVTLELDVAKGASIATAKQFVEKTLPTDKGLWAVVNNAGIAGVGGPLEWVTEDDFRNVIEINFFGVVFVTKAFLPLIRKGKGRIVNMASILGRIGLACSHYSASKFAVEGFSDQLRRELYQTGVSVHIIEPGYFRTNIVNETEMKQTINARFAQAPEEIQRYYGQSYKDAVCKSIAKVVSNVMSTRLDMVVEAYEHAITARFPKARYVVGWDAQIYFRFLWNLPEWLSDYIVTKNSPIAEGAHR